MLKKFRKAWKESGEQSRQSRDRDRLFRKEKRRREAFPGKYSPLFYRIIWKNFLYNRKDYVLFLLCGMMLTAFAFSLLGSYEMLAGLHSDEGVMVGLANVGEGLRRIVVNAMVPLGITLVILLIYILIFYLRKRMQGYSMFQTLGIRKKTLYVAMVAEILANMVLSALLGLILGNVMTVLIRNGMEALLGQSIPFTALNAGVYGKALALVVLVYAITFVGLVYVSDFNPILAKTRTVKSEWMPEKHLPVWIDAGVLLTIGGLLAYRKIWSFEKISLVVMCCIGLYVLIRFGGAAFLRKEKQGKHYLDKLMDRNFLYHKSSTLAWYLIAITAISLCAVFYFAFQAVSITIAEEAESLFPYEFMCFTDDEDEEFLEDLKQRNEVTITSYPMVRVSTVDRTPYVESRLLYLPQGQHIGISESTYHALKQVQDPDYQPRDLGLDTVGEKIYLVHQQDRSIKAQPIDYFDLIKTRPCLHIGVPCEFFNNSSAGYGFAYPRRTIVGEETSSLTGCFRDGERENLVVFSDEFFETALELWKDTSIWDGGSITELNEKYGETDGVMEAIPGVTIFVNFLSDFSLKLDRL